MDKFIVEVKAPVNNKTYEFLIPKNMKAGEAAHKIAAEICEFEKNADLFEDSNLTLCLIESSKALPADRKLAEEGVRSGMQFLIL